VTNFLFFILNKIHDLNDYFIYLFLKMSFEVMTSIYLKKSITLSDDLYFFTFFFVFYYICNI